LTPAKHKRAEDTLSSGVRSRFLYDAHGLVIDSDIHLPELNAHPAGSPPDSVALRIQSMSEQDVPVPTASQWRARAAYRGWLRTANLPTGTLMKFADSSTFLISLDGQQIDACCGEQALAGQFRHNLLHQAIPYALIAAGKSVLHGGAIDMGEGVAIFLGASGAGKSTIVQAFAAQQRPILGDDIVRVEATSGVAMAFPSYPGIRVWSDRATGDTLLPKLRIGASDGLCFAEKVQPIRAIYHLQSGRTAAPTFARVPALTAAKLFFSSTYLAHVVGRDAATDNFKTLLDIALAVPVFTVKYRRSLSSLPKVTDAITAHFQKVRMMESICAPHTQVAP